MIEDRTLPTDIERRVSRTVRFRFRLDPAGFDRRVDEVLSAHAQGDRSRLLASLVLDDLYLATACAAGEEAAWEEFSEAHFPFIRDFALRCTGRDPPAGDVAESVIADLWQRGKLRQFAGRSSLRTWLGTVVARTSINAGKRSAKTVSLDSRPGRAALSPPDARAPAADETFAREIAEAATAEIANLDPSDRLLLLLYYEQEMTLARMEKALHKSKAALSRRLDRVRKLLRSAIERRLGRAGRGSGVDLARVRIDLETVLSPSAKREIGLEAVSQP
jgi:RNA polymerase sigma factor (sigma-70 family)